MSGERDVCVVGLGYVGLTLATALADAGFAVLGVERRAEVVAATNRGRPHFSEAGLAETLAHVSAQGTLRAENRMPDALACPIHIITVGTPLDAAGNARLDFIEAASREVAAAMPEDALVILRSTVKIGTARRVVAPILAASGKRFALAVCPERTLEGRAMQELRQLPQIVGADDAATRERAAHFFYKLTHTVVQVSSLEAGEIVKLVDNTYRDVQFGFANEVARICDAWGVNAMEVIGGGALGYPRTRVALPGLVGGPCLEKDPHILAQSCAGIGLDLDIAPAARRVNERQPGETAQFVLAEHARRRPGAAPEIALMGLAFKGVPATDDLRGSMALRVLAALAAAAPQARFRLHDPVCSEAQLAAAAPGHAIAPDIERALDGADIAVIANNHPALGALRPKRMAALMAPTGFVYDYWNHFSDLRPHELGEAYFAVGNAAARAG